ncbi:UNVERIFIED_CONTAM: hypothetical protein FKN15_070298 [Acipenser sinensis]
MQAMLFCASLVRPSGALSIMSLLCNGSSVFLFRVPKRPFSVNKNHKAGKYETWS